MSTSIAELKESVARQAALIPAIYGRVDFSITPERFTAEPDAETELEPAFAMRRAELLAHEELVADAYAALIPQLGFKRLIAMLDEGCDHGVQSVASAPPELVRFIESME